MTGKELLSDIYFYYLTINAALVITSLFMENRKRDYLLKFFLVLFCLCAFYDDFTDYPILFIIPRVGIELILANENTNKIGILQKIRYYSMFTLNSFSTSVLIFSLLIVTFDIPTYWP